MNDDERPGLSDVDYAVSYGKREVRFQRVYARPLTGLTPIPESSFIGRSNVLFAAEVDVDVLGADFLPAYTVGDNASIVATDSMKNIIIREAIRYDGGVHEGYLLSLAETFVARYDHLHDLSLTIRETPFSASLVADGGVFVASDVLFGNLPGGERSVARMHVIRGASDGGAQIASLESGRTGIKLLKVTGSSFTAFVHDEHTTLPDRRDRPLFIHLDVFWTYRDPRNAIGENPARYVAGEQVGDLCRTVFHRFVSESIQHLVHEIGRTILARFPQLLSVRFVAQNHTRDPWHQSEEGPRVRVYSEPFPAYGEITLKMTRTSGEA